MKDLYIAIKLGDEREIFPFTWTAFDPLQFCYEHRVRLFWILKKSCGRYHTLYNYYIGCGYSKGELPF